MSGGRARILSMMARNRGRRVKTRPTRRVGAGDRKAWLRATARRLFNRLGWIGAVAVGASTMFLAGLLSWTTIDPAGFLRRPQLQLSLPSSNIVVAAGGPFALEVSLTNTGGMPAANCTVEWRTKNHAVDRPTGLWEVVSKSEPLNVRPGEHVQVAVSEARHALGGHSTSFVALCDNAASNEVQVSVDAVAPLDLIPVFVVEPRVGVAPLEVTYSCSWPFSQGDSFSWHMRVAGSSWTSSGPPSGTYRVREPGEHVFECSGRDLLGRPVRAVETLTVLAGAPSEMVLRDAFRPLSFVDRHAPYLGPYVPWSTLRTHSHWEVPERVDSVGEGTESGDVADATARKSMLVLEIDTSGGSQTGNLRYGPVLVRHTDDDGVWASVGSIQVSASVVEVTGPEGVALAAATSLRTATFRSNVVIRRTGLTVSGDEFTYVEATGEGVLVGGAEAWIPYAPDGESSMRVGAQVMVINLRELVSSSEGKVVVDVPDGIMITADKLVFYEERGLAVLSAEGGPVLLSVVSDDIALAGKAAEIHVDTIGEVLRLRGSVGFQVGDLAVSGSEAFYSHPAQRVTITGEPANVTDLAGATVLASSAVVLDLLDGSVEALEEGR